MSQLINDVATYILPAKAPFSLWSSQEEV